MPEEKSDQDIFNNENNNNENENQNNLNNDTGGDKPAEPSHASDPNELFKDHLANIKDEEGRQKYKTVQDALNALTHSQNHIKTLESERDSDRQELQKLKEEVGKIETLEQTLNELTDQQKKELSKETPGAVDESLVADLVKKQLEARETESVRASNRSKVAQTLVSKFGEDNVRKVLADKANSLGTTPDKLGQLSEESPDLVISLFDNSGNSSASPTTSSVHIPQSKQEDDTRPPKPEKSLLSGASSEEQAAYMAKIRQNVYKRNGITE